VCLGHRERGSAAGIAVQAGVHTGECEVIGEKIGGIAVHIGARVAAMGGLGEVLLSTPLKQFGCVSNLGAAKRLRAQDQNKTKEKTYAVHDADDPQCLQRQ
jgi:hypothetical protein